jgi:hypothetical protein
MSSRTLDFIAQFVSHRPCGLAPAACAEHPGHVEYDLSTIKAQSDLSVVTNQSISRLSL